MRRGLTPLVPTTTASTSSSVNNTGNTITPVASLNSTSPNRFPYNQGYSVTNGGLHSPLITPAPVACIAPPAHQQQYIPNGTAGSAQLIETVVQEEIKGHFATAEGIYKKLPYGTYSRPIKVPIVNVAMGLKAGDCPVNVSFVKLPSLGSNDDEEYNANLDKICFNVGRELFVYDYVSVGGSPNLNTPLDKRIYKGTFPTAHSFNQETATSTSISLIIGFSAGQVQLIDPLRKDTIASKLFNEELNIDKSPVTCIKWIPGMPHCFMVGHESGNLFTYNENFLCLEDPPVYQVFKQGDDYTVYTLKTKALRNPVSRWHLGASSIGSCINQFEFFQRDSLALAVTSQDGYLRIFDYHAMELIGLMKSYFGGLLCLAWSADGRLVATGGEDDLITVYSVTDKRVVCRGQGHKGWVAQVAFDPYTNGLNTAVSNSSLEDGLDTGSLDDFQQVYTSDTPMANGQRNGVTNKVEFGHQKNHDTLDGFKGSASSLSGGYRLGSVGHDTQLLLWDITEDVLASTSKGLLKNGTVNTTESGATVIAINSEDTPWPMLASTSSEGAESKKGQSILTENNGGTISVGSSAKSKLKKIHKRGLSIGNRISRAVGVSSSSTPHDHINSPSNGSNGHATSPTTPTVAAGMIGSPICPKMKQVPLIEPLITKKIAHERLTVLIFREESIVTGCQEGFICTWARPGRVRRQSVGSGKTTTSALGAIEGIQQHAANV